MIRRFSLLLVAGVLALAPRLAHAQLKVVTSTTDLYDIAKSVGGDKITATPFLSPHTERCSRAAARNVSPAARRTDRFRC